MTQESKQPTIGHGKICYLEIPALDIQQVLALAGTPAEHFPGLTGFEWTASLSIADRQTMRNDFLLGLRQAMENNASYAENVWRQFDQIVYEWKATADVLTDPELTRRLRENWSMKDEVQLKRP